MSVLSFTFIILEMERYLANDPYEPESEKWQNMYFMILCFMDKYYKKLTDQYIQSCSFSKSRMMHYNHLDMIYSALLIVRLHNSYI